MENTKKKFKLKMPHAYVLICGLVLLVGILTYIIPAGVYDMVEVNGKNEVVSLEINPEAVDPDDVEMLQDMVIAAVNEALRNAESDKANNMSRMTGGLNLGGLF